MLIYAAYISLCLPHLSIKIFASHTQDQTAIHVDDLCDEISLNFNILSLLYKNNTKCSMQCSSEIKSSNFAEDAPSMESWIKRKRGLCSVTRS